MVRVRYIGTVRLFVMVRVWYVGTLFELKIPDFLYIAPDFCMQRQKTAKSNAKCVCNVYVKRTRPNAVDRLG